VSKIGFKQKLKNFSHFGFKILEEEKILCDDEQSRINKLENLLLIYRANSSKDVLQMIQNSAELYKKLFVSDVLMQNQYSEDFINYLTRILIVIAAIKRDGQGFLSIVSISDITVY
jgi:hypothetical protein